MAAIEQGHPHLHHRLQQFGRVIGHDGDEQGIAARAPLHRLRIGGHLGPGGGRLGVAGLAEQLAVGQGDAGGEIPGHRVLVPGWQARQRRTLAAASAPDRGEIAAGGGSGEERIEGQQAALTGQVGGKQGIEIDHIRRRAGKHRRQ